VQSRPAFGSRRVSTEQARHVQRGDRRNSDLEERLPLLLSFAQPISHIRSLIGLIKQICWPVYCEKGLLVDLFAILAIPFPPFFDDSGDSTSYDRLPAHTTMPVTVADPIQLGSDESATPILLKNRLVKVC
jgi:hypothetical protein